MGNLSPEGVSRRLNHQRSFPTSVDLPVHFSLPEWRVGHRSRLFDDSNIHIQLWRTADPITSFSGVPTKPVADFILEVSPDETSAAIVRLRETTIIVFDLKSGHPRLATDTRINVLDLRVTVSIVVLVGEGTVVTWNLPTEDCVLDASAGINDSVLTTRFAYRSPLVPRTSISLYA